MYCYTDAMRTCLAIYLGRFGKESFVIGLLIGLE